MGHAPMQDHRIGFEGQFHKPPQPYFPAYDSTISATKALVLEWDSVFHQSKEKKLRDRLILESEVEPLTVEGNIFSVHLL